MLNISNKRFRSSFFFAPKKFLLWQFNGSVDNIQFGEGGNCKADVEVYLEALSRVECQWPSKEEYEDCTSSCRKILLLSSTTAHRSSLAAILTLFILPSTIIKAPTHVYALFTAWGGNVVWFCNFQNYFNLICSLSFNIKVTICTPFVVSATPSFLTRCYCYHPSFDAHIAHASEQDMQNAYK